MNNQQNETREQQKDELESAKSYLRRLLKYRPRTEKELKDRLGERGFPQKVVSCVIQWAREKGHIDDRLFAQYLVNDRLDNKPKGRSGLYKELLDHGVDPNLAQKVLEDKLSSEKERQMCRQLAEKRLCTYEGESTKAKFRKTFGFLQRRGFPKGLAKATLKELLFQDG